MNKSEEESTSLTLSPEKSLTFFNGRSGLKCDIDQIRKKNYLASLRKLHKDQSVQGDALKEAAHQIIKDIKKLHFLEQDAILNALKTLGCKLSESNHKLLSDGQQRMTIASSFQVFSSLKEKKLTWEGLIDCVIVFRDYLNAVAAETTAAPLLERVRQNFAMTSFFVGSCERFQEKKFTVKEQFDKPLTRPDKRWAMSKELKSFTLGKIWRLIKDESLDLFPLKEEVESLKIIEKQVEESHERYQIIKMAILPVKLSSMQLLHGKAYPVLKSGGSNGYEITASFKLTKGAGLAQRFKYDDYPVSLAAVMGSTYFGLKKPDAPETTLCMDANHQIGPAGATADGYGHFHDPVENKRVQLAASRAVKAAARYALMYHDPDHLYHDMTKIFSLISKTVTDNDLRPEAPGQTSCVLSSIFPDPKDASKVIVIAGGLGDSMVAVWDPIQKKFAVLVGPRQYLRNQQQYTPLSVTEKIVAQGVAEVLCGKFIGSKYTVVFRMTDGVWETLPHKRNPPVNQNNWQYIDYTFDENAIQTFFQKQASFKATARDYRDYLVRFIEAEVTSTLATRLESAESAKICLNFYQQNTDNDSLHLFLEYLTAEKPTAAMKLRALLDSAGVIYQEDEKLSLAKEREPFRLGALHRFLTEDLQVGDDIALQVVLSGNILEDIQSRDQIEKLSKELDVSDETGSNYNVSSRR